MRWTRVAEGGPLMLKGSMAVRSAARLCQQFGQRLREKKNNSMGMEGGETEHILVFAPNM